MCGATACGKLAEVGVVWGLAAWLAGSCESEAGAGRCCEMVDRPARREMRSARSASRLFCDACWWCWLPRWLVVARAWPRLPSLMAVVERADSEVVVEVGVPLEARREAKSMSERCAAIPEQKGGREIVVWFGKYGSRHFRGSVWRRRRRREADEGGMGLRHGVVGWRILFVCVCLSLFFFSVFPSLSNRQIDWMDIDVVE